MSTIKIKDLSQMVGNNRLMTTNVSLNNVPSAMSKGTKLELLTGTAILLFEQSGRISKNSISCVSGEEIDQKFGVDFIYGNYYGQKKVMGLDVTSKLMKMKDNLRKKKIVVHTPYDGNVVTIAVRDRNSYMKETEFWPSSVMVYSVTHGDENTEIGSSNEDIWMAAQAIAYTMCELENKSSIVKGLLELYSSDPDGDFWNHENSRLYRKWLRAF